MTHILVIDDEELVRISLEEVLAGAGHKVSLANDGEQGIKMCKESHFDVVITDIIMPNKEGVETILELKEHYPDVKIIAISGGARDKADSYLEIAYSLGANKSLTKPFSSKTILDCVDDVMSGVPHGVQ